MLYAQRAPASPTVTPNATQADPLIPYRLQSHSKPAARGAKQTKNPLTLARQRWLTRQHKTVLTLLIGETMKTRQTPRVNRCAYVLFTVEF